VDWIEVALDWNKSRAVGSKVNDTRLP